MPKPKNDRMISNLRRALDDYAATDEDDFETALRLAIVSGLVSTNIFKGIKIYLKDDDKNKE